MLNNWLDGEGNVTLAEPPAGVWRRVLQDETAQAGG